MKSKGFTLIELLITIGLIAVVTTIIVVNTSGLQTKETSAEATKFQNNVTTAGCSFIDSEANNISRIKCKNGATCQVPLSLLVSEGLIDENTIDPATKKKVSEELDSVYVEVAWNNVDGYKEKTCTYKTGTVSGDMPTNTTSAPLCKNPVVPTTVQIDPVTITYGCDPASVDGCMSKDESKTYTETTNETINWTIEDYYNLKTNCSYNVSFTIDNTDPTIKANANPLTLGNGDYDFKNNVTATFGPAGGTVTCTPATTKRSGSYTVTCTAKPNNRKASVSVTFAVKHSYPATSHYVGRSCPYSCNCHQVNEDCSYCCSTSSNGCRNCCTGYCFRSGCGSHQECGTCYSDCSYTYYACPDGGTLSGTTCNY